MSLLLFLSLLCYIENALALLVVPTQDISSPKSRGRSLNDCVDLKVMPLGASITWGTDSTTGDGYRRALGQLILDGGNNVAFTGTRENGDFDDNAVEAYPGDTIDEVARKSRSSGSYDYLPNVILIHLGTNDCSLKIDLANAPTRMANLVRDLTSAIPETTVIVSNLIPNLDPETEQCIEMVNKGFQTEVRTLANNGFKVVFADMHSAVPTSDINPVDKTHPNDDGYDKMAHVWYEALGTAASLLSNPSSSGKVGYVRPQDSIPKCNAVAASSSSGQSSTAPFSVMSTSISIPSSAIPLSTTPSSKTSSAIVSSSMTSQSKSSRSSSLDPATSYRVSSSSSPSAATSTTNPTTTNSLTPSTAQTSSSSTTSLRSATSTSSTATAADTSASATPTGDARSFATSQEAGRGWLYVNVILAVVMIWALD